jgi:hypothetical protein
MLLANADCKMPSLKLNASLKSKNIQTSPAQNRTLDASKKNQTEPGDEEFDYHKEISLSVWSGPKTPCTIKVQIRWCFVTTAVANLLCLRVQMEGLRIILYIHRKVGKFGWGRMRWGRIRSGVAERGE